MRHYLSLIKFSHTVFALPFALIGFFLGVQHAGGQFRWQQFALILACMVFARSAAMAFNRYIDSDIDALNERTSKREIPAGVISKSKALLFVIVNSIAFIIAAGMLNSLCLWLSPVALLVILGYSLTKRFTWLCHFVLGLGLALAPVGAYLAVKATFNWLPVMLGVAVLTWVSGFDIIYALQDEDFDREQQLFSIPSAIGRKNAIGVSIGIHFITAITIILVGTSGVWGNWYWMGAGFFSAMLAYQHWLVRPNDLSKVNMAFFTTNGIASVIFGIFVIFDIVV